MKTPKPRNVSFYGMPIQSTTFPDGTWLEGEEFAYPNGGFARRAMAQLPDASRRVVRCSIPDTFFSIPCRLKSRGKTVKGFITTDEDGVRFHAEKTTTE